MFERFLTNAITTHFGHVVDGLDADKIRLSAWNGELVLEDLALRFNALDHWIPDCPVEIAYGRIGALEIRIPWKVIRSQFTWRSASESLKSMQASNAGATTALPAESGMQCAVVLSDVRILVIPRKKVVSDELHEASERTTSTDTSLKENDDDPLSNKALSEEEQRRNLEKAVQVALEAKLLQHVAAGGRGGGAESMSSALSSSSNSSSTSTHRRWQWIQMRVAEIIANLVVTVKNIHIRYEDPGTSMGFVWNINNNLDSTTSTMPPIVRYRPPFAIGVVLRQFTVRSVDDDRGRSAVVTENGNPENDKQIKKQTVVVPSSRDKIASAEDLAVYWDSGCRIVSEEPKTNDAGYFEQVFDLLAYGALPVSFSAPSPPTFQPRHAFVLDPFSPLVRLKLKDTTKTPAMTVPPSANGTEESKTTISKPSSMEVTLPPCHLSISRSLLEDVGYLRKSVAVWLHRRQGLLSEKSHLRLLRLRPRQSPRVDPRSWWRYAKEAVLEFQRVGLDARTYAISRRRLRGWLGVAQTMGRRRRYIELYKEFLQAGTRQSRLDYHGRLGDLEKELLIPEIVAFRLAACRASRACRGSSLETQFSETESSPSKWQWSSASSSVSRDSYSPELNDVDCLSARYRMRMLIEMAEVLDRDDSIETPVGPKRAGQQQRSYRPDGEVVWMTSLKCSEISVQINDKIASQQQRNRSDKHSPVVRLSCAFLQEQLLFADASWEITSRVGDLVVKDCISNAIGSKRSGERLVFPYLVGPKKGGPDDKSATGKLFELDGVVHQESVMVRLRRDLAYDGALETGSTTTTQIRVLPLEIVYATKPVEALGRILSTANMELADDYHRIASSLAAWKERQQKRLMMALAHKKKTILVDIDVGAPVLLLPEGDQDGMLLVIDLGRLRFENDNRTHVHAANDGGFDDRWHLELSRIQMSCCLCSAYRRSIADPCEHPETDLSLPERSQRLIEPFSLNFSIGTKIMRGQSEGQTSVQVVATLPRLAFNLTSSAVRLLRRLQVQWQERRLEMRPEAEFRLQHRFSILPVATGDIKGQALPRASIRPKRDQLYNRKIEFQFNAPLLCIKLDNDVDGRDCMQNHPYCTTPLFDLSLRGMEASIRSEAGTDGSKLYSHAKVRTLTVMDLYQRAGTDFAPLVSSVAPALLCSLSGTIENPERYASSTDLVTFEYVSVRRSTGKNQVSLYHGAAHTADELKVCFHELYVEWNPETIAAAHKAVKVSGTGGMCEAEEDDISQSEEDFFDAEEYSFFDAASVASEESLESLLISEISSSRVSSFADLRNVGDADHMRWQAWHGLGSPLPRSLPSPGIVSSPWPGKFVESPTPAVLPEPQQNRIPFILTFEMSKLSVNFNKEARHRRVMITEMDGTHITYTQRSIGGYHISAELGNLTFADPSSLENKTLYREVLGLKTDTQAGKPSSLLEMEYTHNVHSRKFLSVDETVAAKREHDRVLVDLASGTIRGYDNKLEARLSPMRFVYMQQLWFEFVDYFFEGITGFEVWGNSRPPPLDPSSLDWEASETAVQKITFTLFAVAMEAPVILFPVASCSTDFVRVQANNITIGNKYRRGHMRRPGHSGTTGEPLMQWYNSCDVAFEGIEIFNSTGTQLTENTKALEGTISLNWPTGTTASLNVPKWKVHSSVDSLSLTLRREDFALLQNIVGHNLGESSRYLEEWLALQALPPGDLDRYLKEIFVHFGYDKKDVTPTTFDVTLNLPMLSFHLVQQGGREIAETSIPGLTWEYKKLSDLVSRQKVACDVKIAGVVNGSKVPILSHSDQANRREDGCPMLIYTSITKPNRDNSRSLEISDPHISTVIAAWQSLSNFFQSLPAPSFLLPDEVIQIGDRWYRIGEPSPTSRPRETRMPLNWVPGGGYSDLEAVAGSAHQALPLYLFNLVLRRPRIRLGTELSALIISMESLEFVHTGKDMRVRRKIDLKGIEARLAATSNQDGSQESSLMHPWSISGTLERCNGQHDCCCALHAIRVSTGTIKTRAAYTDMIVAVDVFMQLTADLKSSNRLSPRASLDRSVSSGFQTSDVKAITQVPKVERFHFVAEKLTFTVTDDSGRHFAGSQELMAVTADTVDFRTEKSIVESMGDPKTNEPKFKKSMHLRVQSMVPEDCLQVKASPFRHVVVLKPLEAPGSGQRESLNHRSVNGSGFHLDSSRSALDRAHGLEVLHLVNESNLYNVIIGSVEAQYNPCLVIASQRFLGRLSKHYGERRDEAIGDDHDAVGGTSQTDQVYPANAAPSRGRLELGKVSICLNKEHQERRLAQAVLTTFILDTEKDEEGSCVSGHVRSFEAFVPSSGGRDGSRRDLARSSESGSHFLEFKYRTFVKSRLLYGKAGDRMPQWLHSYLEDNEGRIDDYLEIGVATMEAKFVRDHTEELVDYLGNGMPGRGMGATSRAAKGFVKDRIKKRSFLHLVVDAPLILIPESQDSTNGIMLQLGDLRLLSWIEPLVANTESLRKVSTSLRGGACCIYRLEGHKFDKKNVVERIDISVEVEKYVAKTSLSSKVSDVSVNLFYTDYLTVLAALRENLTKPIDKRAWDNLEAKFEESQLGAGTAEGLRYSADVEYASSARHVRYGQTMAKLVKRKNSTLNLRFSLGSLSLVLRRDDSSLTAEPDYDMFLARGQDLEASFVTSLEGHISVNLSLREIFAFDLGEGGRAIRDNNVALMKSPRKASVLVEGYSPNEKDLVESFDSHLVLKVDKDSSTDDIKVAVIASYLSVAPLKRAMQDISSFATCRWKSATLGIPESTVTERPPAENQNVDRSSAKSSLPLNFRIVLHYPRFVFVVDEFDPHSRALALRGLAIANARHGSAMQSEPASFETTTVSTTRINADFQNISSYILPDVGEILSPRVAHLQILGERFSRADMRGLQQNDESGATEDLGVPLLLPLTMGLEFEQQTRPSFPSKRSISFHVDPLSLMFGSEDLQVVDSIVSQWSSKSRKSESVEGMIEYDALFQSEKLGLGLRKDEAVIVVDHVKEPALSKGILLGDVIYAINGKVVRTDMTLVHVVERLQHSQRPLKVTFLRPGTEETVEDGLYGGDRNEGSVVRMDVSFSSAILTFLEKDVPLVRGEVWEAKVSFGMTQGLDTSLRLSVTSAVAIHYYNLSIWGWEPIMEQGKITFAAEFLDPRDDARQLTLEFGDGHDGLALNVTDGAAETISKLLEWGHRSEGALDVDEDHSDLFDGNNALKGDSKRSVSRNAANAALQYARRQRRGAAKPFVFCNRTGLSVAVVQQRKKGFDTQTHESTPFLAVGDYGGLELYDPSQITVIGSGEDFTFRVDVVDDDSRSQAKFPTLVISLQTIGGIEVEPLVNLQMHSPGETFLPLRYHKVEERSTKKSVVGHQLAVWRVEQVDEKTVMTLGGSLQILSMLPGPVEVGVRVGTVTQGTEEEETKIKSIGTAHHGHPFFLPLWLEMQDKPWSCCVKIDKEYRFSQLARRSEDGFYSFWPLSGKTIGFFPRKGTSAPIWLAASVSEDSGMYIITIDSLISLRNLLPTDVEWEIADSVLSPIDGSLLRGSSIFGANNCSLGCGEKTEVLARTEKGLVARFNQTGVVCWSQWVSLSLDSLPDSNKSAEDDGAESPNDLITTRYAQACDAFGIPQSIGVRISQKECGFDVIVFAELWCINSTSLDLTFGSPRERGQIKVKGDSTMVVPTDLTAAEAALKEISSLFESGQEGKGLGNDAIVGEFSDVVRLVGHGGSYVIEEFFEYVDTANQTLHQHWWAAENPVYRTKDPASFRDSANAGWFWIDPEWKIDQTGQTSVDGWESSPTLSAFPSSRGFNRSHRYRRRRWYRKRSGLASEHLVKGVHAFYQPRRENRPGTKESKAQQAGVRIGIQVDGGQWALSSGIPRLGKAYGAIRVRASRWSEMILSKAKIGNTTDGSSGVFELCYRVAPLEGVWGELSRYMLVSSRFVARNDSKQLSFEIKQTGASDSMSILIRPGEKVPFHWSDSRRPKLISVRPWVGEDPRRPYRWSGGFDPLTIGAVPLRIRRNKEFENAKDYPIVRSIKMEAELRPKTGGTGINLLFEEEDPSGDGALFRVENWSTFPIWISQDGILANPSWGVSDGPILEGFTVQPSQRSCFALDVPFRQGKYSGRKAASMAELLRLRLALAPLISRAGIETTKVISLAKIGSRERLNPAKLTFLGEEARSNLGRVRVLAVVTDDGPTTVLSLRLMEKDTENLLVNPFVDDSSFIGDEDEARSPIEKEIIAAAEETIQIRARRRLPTEEEAMSRQYVTKISSQSQESRGAEVPSKQEKDLQISLRVAIRGFVISLVDSAPSEIAVLTLKNVNSIASWNVHRTTDATVYVTVTSVQLDNMIPNAPFPVAVYVADRENPVASSDKTPAPAAAEGPPVLVLGLSFAPRHRTGILCLKSATLAPRNLAVRVDLAFLVRLQKYVLDLQGYFHSHREISDDKWPVPDTQQILDEIEAGALSGVGRQKFFFGGLTILPWNVRLSVAPARALTPQHAALEGPENAAIHQAVRKGDVRLNRSSAAVLGVKVGSRNKTPLAVVRGVFRSIVVDGLLRLDGASVTFAGVSLGNITSTRAQLSTQLGAHYLSSLRQNVPALLGSMDAIGNPIGLVRGLGDGVSDFVLEPVKGFRRSVQHMDASYLVDGVGRGTLSLARHTVGGFADSAAKLTETFSKNMVALTLDRRYAQARDRGDMLREHDDINVALGLGSGVQKLVTGFLEGVTGVVKAPLRGAEKKGLEGFAKGIGKGLLGLLVKPIIGISDGIADVMIGVKGTVDGASGLHPNQPTPVRPRRAFYGREKVLRSYNMADAAAAALMMRTRLSGEPYLSHLDMGDRVALLSVKRLLLLGSKGQELLAVKFKHIESLEVRKLGQQEDGVNWSIVVLLNTPRSNGSDVEVITCKEEAQARELCSLMEQGLQALEY